jgi:hypothetical protein
MKIIQTFWSGNQTKQNYIFNKGGWLSAEYHWMAWALSCLQLKKFYPTVELITDSIGKEFFEKVLKLPYSQVHSELDTLNQYDKRLWALAKIYSYSIQNKPFIHIDGDIFIWKSFDEDIVKGELIAQNVEIDFSIYQKPFHTIKEEFVSLPPCLKKELESQQFFVANAGIIGGKNIDFFKQYKKLAFDLINDNLSNIDKVENFVFNNCYEQFLYYALAKSEGIKINYLFPPVQDSNYPNYADFHEVPLKRWYIHAMSEYKQNPEVCHHLARRLRMDYPEYYYRIIELCKEEGIKLDWKCYQKDLDATWQTFYEKDKATYQTVELLFGKQREQILATQLQFSPDCQIEEIETPEYGQFIHYPDITKLEFSTKTLDNLSIILLDIFQEQISIAEAIEAIKPYFDSEEINQDPKLFEDLILSRIKDFMFMGVIVLA